MKFRSHIATRLATFAVGVVVILAAVKLWPFNAIGTIGDWALTVTIGAGFGSILAVWFLGAWLRSRQRRRLAEMRDSALW
jgi:hypothetical protein